MRNNRRLFLVLSLLGFGLASSVSAHHGTAGFDRSKTTTLKGTVTGFLFQNPHGAIDFDVKDAGGNVDKWKGFLTSPNWLARAGWTKNTLKPGDMITLIGNQSKDHSNSLWVTKIELSNGQELPIGGPENF
jgi:hypothetical protein